MPILRCHAESATWRRNRSRGWGLGSEQEHLQSTMVPPPPLRRSMSRAFGPTIRNVAVPAGSSNCRTPIGIGVGVDGGSRTRTEGGGGGVKLCQMTYQLPFTISFCESEFLFNIESTTIELRSKANQTETTACERQYCDLKKMRAFFICWGWEGWYLGLHVKFRFELILDDKISKFFCWFI